MGLLECASNASTWRGYEYYKENKVKEWNKTGEGQYECKIKGSSSFEYHVRIDIKHPRKSSNCNCPYAKGKMIVCKHQVALYFAVFPDEANRYIKEIEEYERDEEEREQELYIGVAEYVNSLSEEEVRERLIREIMDSMERERYW